MSLAADLKYSAKSLARTPGVTLALLLTIALGIGGNASVFGFIRGLVTRDMPLPGMDTAVSLFARDGKDSLGPLSYERYLSIKGHAAVFQAVGAVRETRDTIVIGGRSTFMSVAAVTPEAADLLQLPLGDGVVISRRAWLSEFGGKARVRGDLVSLAGRETRVGSVAPEWLEGLYAGRAVDIWVPLQDASIEGADRTSRTFWAVGRLAPGASRRQAETAVNAGRDGTEAIAILPFTGLGPEAASGISRLGALLPAAAAAVFVIACANVAVFLLSRASARAHETAVRVALGASRKQLGRQLLADSAVLSLAGGACGILIAVWTAQIIPAFFFIEDAEHLVFAPNIGGILLAAGTCAAVTIACGVLPLVEVKDDDPALVLRRESGGPSPVMQRVRAGLVVAQMACCCLLVISTGLLFQGFRAAMATSTGTRLGHPLLATVHVQAAFDRPDLGLQFYRDAEQTALALPGIYEAAWVGAPPGARATWQTIRVERPASEVRDAVMQLVPFTPKTLPLIRTPPLAGRMFSGADTPQACPVAIVNAEANDAFFDGNAVGRSIENLSGARVEIVGVVADRKDERTPGSARPTIYYYAQQAGLTPDQGGPTTFRVPVYAQPEATGVLDANIVSRSYFSAMDVPVVAGEIFPDEPEPQSCRTGVINEEAAELYFGGHPIGGAVIDGSGIRTNIVGVVHTVPLRITQRAVEPAIFFPMTQDFLRRMTLILGAKDADAATLATLRRALDAVDGRGSPAVAMTLEAQLGRTALASERIATILVGACTVSALALGVLGIYGALADYARHRRREIALRMALGAQRWRVMLQVVRQGLRLAALGALAGGLASLPVARWLARISPSAGSLTVWVWLAVPVVLVIAVTIASVLPVGRALAINPLSVMKDN